MKPILAIVAIFSLASPSPARGQQWDTAGTPTTWERAYMASRIYAGIITYFAHWQGVPSYDLSKQYQSYLQQALSAPDRRAFDLATMAFMATLHNAHTSFSDEWISSRSAPIPFRVGRLAGRWVVTSSDVPDLRPGDEVRSIGDESVTAFVEHQRPYISASADRWTLQWLFHSPFLFPEPLSVTLANGRRVTVDRSRRAPAPRTEHRLLADGVGYIHIPGFNPSVFEDSALAYVRANRQLRAMVIDLRATLGGSTPDRLIRALMDRPYRWFTEATPVTFGLFEYYRVFASEAGEQSDYDRGFSDAFGDFFNHAQLSWTPRPGKLDTAAFRGRVVILTDAGCLSACEDFVEPFKDNHRAVILGDTTGGSTGQPYFESFPNGMSFAVSTKRETMPDGSPFEGPGIAPDTVVLPAPDDLRRGVDTGLQKALEILSR